MQIKEKKRRVVAVKLDRDDSESEYSFRTGFTGMTGLT